MAKQKKATKKRTAKYDPKLSINGTFEDVIKISVNYTPPKQQAVKKADKKKK